MHRKILAGILAGTSLLLVAQRSDAQSFGPSFTTSNSIDRILEDAVRAQQRAEEPPGEPEETEVHARGETAAVSEPAKKRFFTTNTASLSYEYVNRNYSVLNDLHSDLHVVLPEVHLKADNGFSLDLSAGYVRSDGQDELRNTLDSDTFFLSALPVLTIPVGNNTSIIPGVYLGYRHLSLETVYSGVGGDSTVDTFVLVPNVSLAHVTSTAPIYSWVSAIASYSYEPGGSESREFLAANGTDGVFSLAARGDLVFPAIPVPFHKDKLAPHLSVTAAWKHNAQASVRSVSGDDSAEFSTNLALPIPLGKRTWTFRVAYTYEAFREDYDAHHAQLYVEVPICKD